MIRIRNRSYVNNISSRKSMFKKKNIFEYKDISKIFIAEAYNKLAENYEDTVVSRSLFYSEHYRAIAKFLLRNVIHRLKRGSLVADLGCGTGFWSILIKKLGFEVIGLDISLRSIEKAYEKGLESFVGDIEKISLRNESFDLVIALASVINHIDSHDQFFKNVSRILKKNGYLVFDFDSAWSIDNLYEALIYKNSVHNILRRFLDFSILQRGYKILWEFGNIYIRLYTPIEIIKELRAQGFEIIKIQPIHILSSIIPVRIQEKTEDDITRDIIRSLHKLDDYINRLFPIPYPLPVSYIVLARKI